MSLAALLVADPARAACSTVTAGGVTTLACTDTMTTSTTNTNENNPSTVARVHRYTPTIDVTVAQGVTVNGVGLLIWPTGSNSLTVTNNGAISNTSGSTSDAQPSAGLEIIGNGGLVTYLGNGSATTNATPPSLAVGLSINNSNGGGINIGSQAAPISGTFSGESGLVARGPGGSFINAWLNGGTFTASSSANRAIELAGLGNVTLVMTGQSVLNAGLYASVYSNAPGTSIVSVTTDAQITDTLGPAMLIGGGAGGTNVTLTSGASITGQATGISMFSDGGEMRLTTAAGTTIHATSGVGGIGVQFQPETGTAAADLSGTITAGGAGLFLVPGNASISVTIREGASVSGNESGIAMMRLPGDAGTIEVLNLGTISSPLTASSFDGSLRIGNGGTSGIVQGNIVNDGSLFFNRSDSVAYAGAVSGAGTLTKQGAGVLTLSGTSTYTGATTVSAGTLDVDGSLTSAVTVASGAGLGGSGSTGGVNSSGTLSPGGNGTIGTLTINGNLNLNAGSNFIVDVGAGVSDRVLVNGTAALAGSLTAVASGGAFTVGSYTLLTANGGLTGSFNPISTQPNTPVRVQNVGNDVMLHVDQGTFSLTTSERQSLVFATPDVTTDRLNHYSTQIIGRLLGGQPLYDQTFAAAYADPLVQNGVVAARAAITTAGGPGVIIGDPVRTSSSTTSSTSSASTFALINTQSTQEQGILTLGPANLTVGALSTCNVASLPSATRPSCQAGGTQVALGLGDTNLNVNTNTVYTVAEARIETVTETLRETWELNGAVVSVGTIHAEVQSGLFDLGSRLLKRLVTLGTGAGGWGEIYRFRIDQLGQRDAWGLAGGFGLAVAPGLRLTFGMDHGQLDIDVPGSVEAGDVDLTELGAALRYDSGPLSASLAIVYGVGNADTLRGLLGVSEADYDVRLSGATLEFGYAIDAGGWTVWPVATLDYTHLSTDAVAESGALGLIAAEQKVDRVRGSAGAEVGRDFGGFTLSGSARYLAVLEGDDRALPVAFAAAPGRSLQMTGANEPDGVLLGARMGVPLAPGASLWLDYNGRFGSDYEEHAGMVGVRVAL